MKGGAGEVGDGEKPPQREVGAVEASADGWDSRSDGDRCRGTESSNGGGDLHRGARHRGGGSRSRDRGDREIERRGAAAQEERSDTKFDLGLRGESLHISLLYIGPTITYGLQYVHVYELYTRPSNTPPQSELLLHTRFRLDGNRSNNKYIS